MRIITLNSWYFLLKYCLIYFDDERELHTIVLKLGLSVFQFPQISNHHHMNLILVIMDLKLNHQKIVGNLEIQIIELHILLIVPILGNFCN